MPFQNMSIKKILKGIHEINTFSFPEFVFVELSSENSKLFFLLLGIFTLSVLLLFQCWLEVLSAASLPKDELLLWSIAVCPQ